MSFFEPTDEDAYANGVVTSDINPKADILDKQTLDSLNNLNVKLPQQTYSLVKNL